MSLSEDLYQMYKDKVNNMLVRMDKIIMTKVSDSKEFLIEYVNQWNHYTIFIYSLNKVMQYLDRFHLKNQGDLSLTETALNLFREKIFRGRLLDLRKATLNEILKDREGQLIEKELIKSAVQHFIYMGYEHKVTIAKKGGATDFDWLGEKNLMTYDAEFQKYLL